MDLDGLQLGVAHIAPALTIGDIRRLLPRWNALSAADPVAVARLVVDTLIASLRRNYPAIDRRTVGGLVDAASGRAAAERLLEQSGLKFAAGESAGEQDWSQIYGLLAAAFGFTKSDVDALTLVDLDDLYLPYLRDHPPLHLMVESYLGITQQYAPASELFGMPGLGRGDVHKGLPGEPILDIKEFFGTA